MNTSDSGIHITSNTTFSRERRAGSILSTGGQPLLLYDLATIVGAIFQQRLTVTKQGTIPKRTAEQLRPLLHGLPRFDKKQVDTYVDMLITLARQLGLVKFLSPLYEEVHKACYGPVSETELEQWFRLDVYGQARQVIAQWRKDTMWRDIWGVYIQQWDSRDWEPIAARGLLLDILSTGVYKTEQWYPLSSLLDLIWTRGPYTLRPAHYRAKSREQSVPAGLRQYWDRCEGIVYSGILSSTLVELGVVSIARSTTQPTTSDPSLSIESFKLTGFGASVLATEHRMTTSTAVRRILTVQPTFELILPEFDPPTLYRLLPFTQVNLIEQASRLTATKYSVMRGIELGIDVDQMIGTLKAASQKALPQNVIRTIQDWAKTYKGAEISEVLLIRVSSEALADELCSTTQLREYGLEKIAPRIVLAHHVYDSWEFNQLLKSLGIVIHD
jgi:Helicase conserved C-terminal domain